MWTVDVTRTPGGLWVPVPHPPRRPVDRSTPALLTHRQVKRTVTLPDGRRALVTIDDSGTVEHTEHGDTLDVVLRPRTIKVRMRVSE